MESPSPQHLRTDTPSPQHLGIDSPMNVEQVTPENQRIVVQHPATPYPVRIMDSTDSDNEIIGPPFNPNVPFPNNDWLAQNISHIPLNIVRLPSNQDVHTTPPATMAGFLSENNERGSNIDNTSAIHIEDPVANAVQSVTRVNLLPDRPTPPTTVVPAASNSEPVASTSSGAIEEAVAAASTTEEETDPLSGVDPSFLAALPENIREEVISEQRRLQRIRQVSSNLI